MRAFFFQRHKHQRTDGAAKSAQLKLSRRRFACGVVATRWLGEEHVDEVGFDVGFLLDVIIVEHGVQSSAARKGRIIHDYVGISLLPNFEENM